MTTDQKQFAAIFAGAILLVLLISSWFWGFERGKKSVEPTPPVVKTDTLWRTDTVVHEVPVDKTRWRDKIVYVPVTDTIVRYDTTFVALQFERVDYEGEDYKATVSGFQPRLESVTTFPKTAYITETKIITEKKKWSFGFTAGTGVFWDGKEIKPGAGFIVGAQYNF